MKKFMHHISSLALISLFFSSCHKLDTPVVTQLTEDNFPQTPAHFIQVAGPTYSSFRQIYAVDYFFLQSLSTDEAIMPARGGNWYDGGRYEQHHKHSWDKDNAHVSGVWNWLTSTISTSNQNLFLLERAEESAAKQTAIAELKTMRAFCIYLMMDLWGNIPVVTTFGDTTAPLTKPRAEVFTIIEKELKDALPKLNPAVGQVTYGRPNKYAAFALLAKMYLNAEVYTSTQRNADAVAMCDSIIMAPGAPYSLESDYKKMFFINNGPSIKDFIFAIPYDNTVPNGYMFYARYSMPRALDKKYSLKFVPSAPMSTLPEYYAHFNDPNDKRNDQWITGKQYLYNGSPVTVATTKGGYDQTYTGSDKGAAFTYHVELTPNIVLRDASRPFDAGNDEIAWNMGYRNNKFYADSTSANRNQNNDVPIFRFADVLLMKAEAILRGATPTNGQTALSLVNQLRAVRTTSTPWTSVTLETLYQERCRELAWECWHRNDMIRFGKYEGTWGFKSNNDVRRRLFPIPASARITNPKLTQNPGYE